MDKTGAFRTKFLAELPDRLKEGQSFNVADRTANLTQDEINAFTGVG